MIILGIETSCDETAAAVVKDGTKILSNVVASSAEMHIKTGGIIPEQAARQQIKSILPVIQETVDRSRLAVDQIDAIAVTSGPGLIGSLLVGVETAKTLSYVWRKPIIPVNHLVGHIYANWLKEERESGRAGENKLPQFPLIALVVSGGHTDLVYMKGHSKIELVGTTRDDAAGECFDKCARILGLPYPGGPAIAAAAARYQIPDTRYKLKMFPRPMLNENNFDFSFSGLKTAVLNEVKGKKRITHSAVKVKDVEHYAAEIQEAVCDVLVKKSLEVLERYEPKSFLLAGGVAANLRLREKISDEIKTKKLQVILHVPKPNFCTDNAASIAGCAFYNQKPIPWQKISANPGLTINS
ncbi:tRNA (adenosine(37)-N6)-threonylcarbamoyltransferase complex transferase subunit TsaD [Patescibacteria group bacterium]|nr:tRNA (adenosine(37)-N6)-threonylcarbamoyltransferase complex transferase subunit TsaD [Patescibacteria group bacterium]